MLSPKDSIACARFGGDFFGHESLMSHRHLKDSMLPSRVDDWRIDSRLACLDGGSIGKPVSKGRVALRAFRTGLPSDRSRLPLIDPCRDDLEDAAPDLFAVGIGSDPEIEVGMGLPVFGDNTFPLDEIDAVRG